MLKTHMIFISGCLFERNKHCRGHCYMQGQINYAERDAFSSPRAPRARGPGSSDVLSMLGKQLVAERVS